MTTSNGHALAPFTIPPSLAAPRGPVSALPRQDNPGRPGTAPDNPGHWRRAIDGDTAIRVLAAAPVVLVNAVAFGAQLGFWHGRLPAAAEAVLVALALESIAVYLAWQAHLAQLADDSALRLRLAAYGIALLIGVLNYSHFMRPGWRPDVAAVTFGMMSAISPWLWSVHSRRVSRDLLKARGLIEPHAVRLGATRWAWHPVRSARVMWHATWLGETDPARAIALSAPAGMLEDRAKDNRTDKDPDTAPDKTAAKTPSRKVTARTGRDRAADIIRRNPDLSNAEVATRARVSEKTAQRGRAAAATREPE